MPNVGPYRPGATQPGRFARVLGSPYQFTISITTVDAAGAILTGCDVHLFHSDTDLREAIGTSDGSGVCTFHPGTNSGYFYAVAFSSDGVRKGATLKTLVAV